MLEAPRNHDLRGNMKRASAYGIIFASLIIYYLFDENDGEKYIKGVLRMT